MGKSRTKGYTTTGVILSCGFFIAEGGAQLVKINGEWLELAGRTLADYLADAGFDSGRVAVWCSIHSGIHLRAWG